MKITQSYLHAQCECHKTNDIEVERSETEECECVLNKHMKSIGLFSGVGLRLIHHSGFLIGAAELVDKNNHSHILYNSLKMSTN